MSGDAGDPPYFAPKDVDELAAWLRGRRPGDAPVCAVGGGTKPALSRRRGAAAVELRHFSGILSYEPSEFTVNVRAGTPLRDVAEALRRHGQCLPFDPPWVEAGSTAGGAVATGISGPGRLRGGGVRDSVLAVRFLDGRGRHARAGAPVVKNVAGFDLPKLFVGSAGGLVILTEITFKVLPAPRAFATALFDYPTLEDAHGAALSVLGRGFSLDGLEILPRAGAEKTLAVRVGGDSSGLGRRLTRLGAHLGHGARPVEDEADLWRRLRDADWAAPDRYLLWIPTPPARVPALAGALRDFDAVASYGGGLTSARVAVDPGAPGALDPVLERLGLLALVLRGAGGRPILGLPPGAALLDRVKKTLDPGQIFPAFGDPSR
ncbi:MAG: FAD-binding protein [Acidobacteriota bacterium]